MQHLHTDYERELVPLFFKVRGYALVKVLGYAVSRSKLDEDAVDRVPVIVCKLLPQFPEKRSLLLVEGLMCIGPVM